MNTSTSSAFRNEASEIINIEKRRDRLVKRISIGAWSVTLVILIAYAAVVGKRVAYTLRLQETGLMPSGSAFETLMPLIIVLGIVSLLIAVLATIGIFLRLRTSSLAEIQMRLTAIEEIILSADRTTL